MRHTEPSSRLSGTNIPSSPAIGKFLEPIWLLSRWRSELRPLGLRRRNTLLLSLSYEGALCLGHIT